MRKPVLSSMEALIRLGERREGETGPRSIAVVHDSDPPEAKKYYTDVPLRHHGRPASDFDEPKEDPAS